MVASADKGVCAQPFGVKVKLQQAVVMVSAAKRRQSMKTYYV